MQPSLIQVLLLLVLLGNLRAADRPNIVYIIADDHTYRDFGFMGSQDALTPNIDRLAAQSARFVNGYVPSSLCSPSLAVVADVAEVNGENQGNATASLSDRLDHFP